MSSSRHLVPIAGLLLIVISTVNLQAAELLPLSPGNNWEYRDALTGESFTVQVGTPVFLNQSVYHTLRGYSVKPLLVRTNQYGNIVYWDEERQTDILLISFELVPRAWWEAPHRVCEQQGQTETRGTHEGPAGRWNVVDIRYRTFGCADAGDLSEQFTENIGMVRRVVNTIIGPRTFDLVRARIGAQVIQAGSVGSFSVGATSMPQFGYWLVTLRLDIPLGTELKLNFPSGKEYDLRLRDSDGNILWAWSADKLFAQIQHERRINGGFSATVTVPYPPTIAAGFHTLTVEAWLTNAESEPRFAAVTRVELSAGPGPSQPFQRSSWSRIHDTCHPRSVFALQCLPVGKSQRPDAGW